MKISHEQAEQLIEELFRLERRGEYEKAISKLGDIWKDKTKKPKIDKFEPKSGAEILLRCGSLIGFLGHNNQIPNSQEQSRDLISESRNIFLKLYDFEKMAECENYIALTYRRTGETNESEVWVKVALSRNITVSSDIRLYSLLIKSMLDIASGNSKQAILDLGKAKPFFYKNGDYFLNGSFCTNLGIALRNLDRNKEALEQYKLAKQFHIKSKHKIYLATIENNLAYLYKEEKQFDKSHLAINNAYKIFREINDRTREGFSLDTKAQIYLVEEKYDEALECSDKAIKILKLSENVAYLVEAYLTRIKILISLDKIFDAIMCLADAVSIAKSQISEDAGNKIGIEIEELLKKKNFPVNTNVSKEKQIVAKDIEKENEQIIDSDFDENSEVILPKELRKYVKLDGVMIINNYSESVGIGKGSMAIVAEEEEIQNGDLAIIIEDENESVYCGYYSSQLDLIGIEIPDKEVRIFNENDITIVGKIVGVGDSKDEQGRLIIKPI